VPQTRQCVEISFYVLKCYILWPKSRIEVEGVGLGYGDGSGCRFLRAE
jgi:hypothetical protein